MIQGSFRLVHQTGETTKCLSFILWYKQYLDKNKFIKIWKIRKIKTLDTIQLNRYRSKCPRWAIYITKFCSDFGIIRFPLIMKIILSLKILIHFLISGFVVLLMNLCFNYYFKIIIWLFSKLCFLLFDITLIFWSSIIWLMKFSLSYTSNLSDFS